MSTNLDAILGSVGGIATGWQQEVERRRKVTPHDPVADTLDFCASELRAELERIRGELHYLTPEQYAQLKGGGVTPQSVRNWIKAGELDAVKGPKGWLIPVTADRKRKAA